MFLLMKMNKGENEINALGIEMNRFLKKGNKEGDTKGLTVTVQ